MDTRSTNVRGNRLERYFPICQVTCNSLQKKPLGELSQFTSAISTSGLTRFAVVPATPKRQKICSSKVGTRERQERQQKKKKLGSCPPFYLCFNSSYAQDPFYSSRDAETIREIPRHDKKKETKVQEETDKPKKRKKKRKICVTYT